MAAFNGTSKSGVITIEQKVAFLKRPESYPGRPRHVDAIETHMAWVFLTKCEAWKLKKPVRTKYLDFSTLENRCHDCRLEVSLNRRLAPDVYRDVVPLTLDCEGRLQLGQPGELVDCLVQMRRLPRDRMLDMAIEQGTVTSADVRRLAEVLANFYRHSPASELGGDEYRARLTREVAENREVLGNSDFDIPHGVANKLLDAQLSILHSHPNMFDERVRLGRVIEAHGDLRPEHVCLEPRPVVIDCLEFNRDLRLLDTASELSFFALECTRLGAAWVGESLLKTCLTIMEDLPHRELLHFYHHWHACTRARIALLHLVDYDVRDRVKWCDRARWYLDWPAAN